LLFVGRAALSLSLILTVVELLLILEGHGDIILETMGQQYSSIVVDAERLASVQVLPLCVMLSFSYFFVPFYIKDPAKMVIYSQSILYIF